MSTARNKEIVKAFVEDAVVGFMQGDRDSFREYLAPDVVFHTPRLTSGPNDIGGLQAEMRAYAELLADANLIVDFVIAEDDFVVIHMTSRAHQPRPQYPPDTPVESGGMAILRVRQERITDVWYYSRHSEIIRFGVAGIGISAGVAETWLD